MAERSHQARLDGEQQRRRCERQQPARRGPDPAQERELLVEGADAGRARAWSRRSLHSNDGGFGFASEDALSFSDASADGYRADLSVGFGDFISGSQGRLTLYTQNLEAGYSAPGLATLTDLEHYGGTFRLPVGERLELSAKADRKVQDLGLETTAQELDVAFQLSDSWSVSTGVRKELAPRQLAASCR